jgi:hypothetical protein
MAATAMITGHCHAADRPMWARFRNWARQRRGALIFE